MRERFDVLSADGLPTGVVKDRDAVHRDGDWHRCGHVWIASGDRVLLQRRALMKESWPGLWDITVAGHVSAGEDSLSAAIREAREELGLELSPSELQPLGTLRYHVALRPGYIENEFHDVYLVRREVDPSSLILDPQEVAEVRWVSLDDLTRYDVVPHDDEYALLRRAIIGGVR